MAEVCQEHSGCKADIEALQKSDEQQWTAIENLRNRPPTWATFALTGMGGVIGYLIALLQIKN